MKLTIRTINDENRSIEIPDDGTLNQLKHDVAHLFNLSESEFSLIYQGRIVKSTRDTLASNQIEDGSVIHLVLRTFAEQNTAETTETHTDPPVEHPSSMMFEHTEHFYRIPFEEAQVFTGTMSLEDMISSLQQLNASLTRIEQSSGNLLSSYNSTNPHANIGTHLDPGFAQMLPSFSQAISHINGILNNFNNMTNVTPEQVQSSTIDSLRSQYITLWNDFSSTLTAYPNLLCQICSTNPYFDQRTGGGRAGRSEGVSTENPRRARIRTETNTRTVQSNPGTTILINTTVFDSSNPSRQPRVISSVNRAQQQASTPQPTPSSADISSLNQNIQAIISNDVRNFNSSNTQRRFPLSVGYRMGNCGWSDMLREAQLAEENLTNFASLVDGDKRMLDLVSTNSQQQTAFMNYMGNKNLNKLYKKYLVSKIERKLQE